MEEAEKIEGGSNFYAVERLTLRRKLMRKLFPALYLPPAEPEEGFVEGEMITETRLTFDWKDRLRILLTGRVMVQTRTQTDVVVSKMRSRSIFYVLPPRSK